MNYNFNNVTSYISIKCIFVELYHIIGYLPIDIPHRSCAVQFGIARSSHMLYA